MGETQISNVTTTHVEALISQINAFGSVNGSHMIFDLGNRELRWTSRDQTPLLITASNVTLRNGTILLGRLLEELIDFRSFLVEPRPLCVESGNVVLERIIINQHLGEVALFIKPGGSVTMRDCEVHNAKIGVQVGNNPAQALVDTAAPKENCARLLAHRVKILEYLDIGVRMEQGARVQLHDCTINAGNIFGDPSTDKHPSSILITGPDSSLHGYKVSCNVADNPPDGTMLCRNGGRAVLESCTLSCKRDVVGLTVCDVGSSVELWYCTFSKKPSVMPGATCFNKRLVGESASCHVGMTAFLGIRSKAKMSRLQSVLISSHMYEIIYIYIIKYVLCTA